MSRSIVRTLEVFREAEGPYAVPEQLALPIIRTAATLVGKHTGRIALTSMTGLRIPTDENPLQLRRLNFGNANHAALVTRRQAAPEKRIPNGGDDWMGACLSFKSEGGLVDHSRVMTSVMPPDRDPTGVQNIKYAAHELGHSFGLMHCAGDCIMNEVVRRPRSAVDTRIMNGNPFCEPCSGDLEIAGYRELANAL